MKKLNLLFALCVSALFVLPHSLKADDVPVTGISLSSSSMVLGVGRSATISATVTPEDATNKHLTLSAVGDQYATVDETGNVTGVAVGQATITVSADGAAEGETVKADCEVYVASVAISKDTIEVMTGDTYNLTATVDAPAAASFDQTIVWGTTNKAVATVSADGTITAIAGGQVKIYAKTKEGIDVVDSCVVNVKFTEITMQQYTDNYGVWPKNVGYMLTGIVKDLTDSISGKFTLVEVGGDKELAVAQVVTFPAFKAKQFNTFGVAEKDTISLMVYLNAADKISAAAYLSHKKFVYPEGTQMTIAQFIEVANETVPYVVSGKIIKVTNATLGNFIMEDATGQLQITGLLNAAGESGKFADLLLAEGDSVTVRGVYNLYEDRQGYKYNEIYNGTFVSSVQGHYLAVTIAEFLAAKNSTFKYELTGVVSDITNAEAGNFTLTDTTASVLIYGMLNEAGEAKKFAELGIESGDTVTLRGAYTIYTDRQGITTEEIDNAEFVSVSKYKEPEPEPEPEPEVMTIEKFISLKDTANAYELTGVVTNIINRQYGYFDLEDETAAIYIRGLLTRTGHEQQFSTMNIEEGDTVTLLGVYAQYGIIQQIVNAVYVSHKKGSGGTTPEPPTPGVMTIEKFLELADTETEYELTGVVSNIKNTTYGNFDLVDETASIYIYGLLTAAGENKQFASMGIEEGDTLTLKGKYTTYNSTPQISNAVYVSHKKGSGGSTPEPPVVTGDTITVAKALEIARALAAGVSTTDTYNIKGYVVEIKYAYDSGYDNQSFYIADTKDGAAEFMAYRVKGMSETVAIGALVVIENAVLTNYQGTTPETTQGATFKVLQEGGDTPEPQPGDDIPDDYIWASEALAIAKALASGATTTETYNIVGYVVAIANNGEYSEQYKNQSFYIGNTASTSKDDAFYVYRVKGLDKTVDVGACVLVEEATLTNYQGNTPETSAGATFRVIDPSQLDDGPTPTPSGLTIPDGATIVAANYAQAGLLGAPWYSWEFSFFDVDDNDNDRSVMYMSAEAMSETKLSGSYVIDTAFFDYAGVDFINGNDTNEIVFAEAQLELIYEGEDADGLPQYEVTMVGKTAEGQYYAIDHVLLSIVAYDAITDEEIVIDEEGKFTPDYIVASEAKAIAEGLASGASSETTYTIQGYVSEIKNEYDSQYKNQTFYISDNKDTERTFLIYRAKGVDETVPVGAYVRITGATITNYGGNTPETTAGATIEIIPEPTALDEIEMLPLDTNAPMYNVLGQKVDASYKGIVIQNGQKYLLR